MLAVIAASSLVAAGSACRRDGPPQAGCRPSEVDLVRDGTLLVGTDVGVRPFAFRDPESRELTGFEVELVQAVASRMRLEVTFVNQTGPGLLAGVVARRYDVVASSVRTSAENRAQVCLGEPYLSASLAIVSARPAEELEPGTPVAVEEGSVAASWASRNLAEAELRTLPTLEDVLGSLEGASAAVVDMAQARHRRLNLIEEIDTGESFALAFNPSHGGLRERMDGHIEALRDDGTLSSLEDKWFPGAQRPDR